MKLKELLDRYGEWEWVSTQIPENGEADVAMIQIKKTKPKTLWNLEYGDRYFVVYLTGEIGDIKFSDCQNDCCVVANGNAFLTEEDAKKDVERRRVETLLLKHGGRRWFKKGVLNYYLLFDNLLKTFTVAEAQFGCRQGVIYFDFEKQAKEAIKEIGEERIKRALFEVR